LSWNFNDLNQMKQFATALSDHLRQLGEPDLADEVGKFDRNTFTTTTEYLGEFRIVLRQVLLLKTLLSPDKYRTGVVQAIDAIDKAFSPRR